MLAAAEPWVGARDKMASAGMSLGTKLKLVVARMERACRPAARAGVRHRQNLNGSRSQRTGLKPRSFSTDAWPSPRAPPVVRARILAQRDPDTL
jgi:hypothetical protein